MYVFAKVGQKNHWCWKAEFLKFYGVSHHFWKIESVKLHQFLTSNGHRLVRARFEPSPNALFCTTLGTLGGLSGFYAPLTLFWTFSLFLSFSLFLCCRQKCVPHCGKTHNSEKIGWSAIFFRLGSHLAKCSFSIEKVTSVEKCLYRVKAPCWPIVTFTSAGIRIPKKKSQNGHQPITRSAIFVLR